MNGRILLVEDDETFAGFVQMILEEDGHEVKSARNGLEGEALLRQENFDLVISDLKMPGKSGLELFRDTKRPRSAPIHLPDGLWQGRGSGRRHEGGGGRFSHQAA